MFNLDDLQTNALALLSVMISYFKHDVLLRLITIRTSVCKRTCHALQASLPLILENGSVDPTNALFLCSFSLLVLWVVLQVYILIFQQ